MNLFLVGISSSDARVERSAADALRPFVVDLPFFGDRSVQEWQAPSGLANAAMIQHPADSIGGVEYTAAEATRLALFSGRPILWVGDAEADGRKVLDPALYLDADDELFSRLDGRFVVVRYDDAAKELTVVSDPLGLYPVYTATANGTRWFSNNAVLLRDVAGSHAFRLEAAAGFLAHAMAIGGQPLWAAVDRLPRGRTLRVRPGADDAITDRYTGVINDLLERPRANPNAGAEAAAIVGAAFGALGDWPGRPNVIGLSGGWDSRLVLAASIRAGVDYPTRTIAFASQPGFPETADVRGAREVAASVGRSHQVIFERQAEDTAAWLSQLVKMFPGTVSAAITGVVTPSPPGAPLEILHSGQNGEWLRVYLGIGEPTPTRVADATIAKFVPRFPRSLLNDEGMTIFRDTIRGYFRAASEAGVATGDLPFYFAVDEEVPHYGPPAHGVYEFREDTTYPLCLWRLVPIVASRPRAERYAGLAGDLLRGLAPSVTAVVEAEGLSRWSFVPDRVNQLATAGTKVARELHRRGGVVVAQRRGRLPDDPLVAVHARAHEQLLASPHHEAWSILDRGRVERLLSRNPRMLDPRSRRQLGTLAPILADGLESSSP